MPRFSDSAALSRVAESISRICKALDEELHRSTAGMSTFALLGEPNEDLIRLRIGIEP